jgi:transmembrane 9 superfamily protein 2/4
MSSWKLFAIACVAMTAVSSASARPLRSSMATQLIEAKKSGASKTDLLKLRNKIKDETKTAKAAGVSMDTLKRAQARGASLDDIKAKISLNNLAKRKRKGILKKRETTLADVLFPGVAPVEYMVDRPIDVIVDTVTSRKTQLPLAYHSLPVCLPKDIKFRGKRKNLGERLMGKDLKALAPYDITVLKDTTCTALCTVDFDYRMIRRMKKLISRDYNVNLSIDSLPAHVPKNNGSIIRGYPLGSKLINEATETVDFVLHNHLRFIIEYNDDDSSPGYVKIVGFKVKPVSIDHTSDISKTCNTAPVQNAEKTLLSLKSFAKGNMPDAKVSRSVTYSYSVHWHKTELPWTDRWDVFLLANPDDSTAHHMSILNSFMIVVFLASCIAIILVKALRKDLSLYNTIGVDASEDEDESGWKMIHGDVFRPPSTSPMMLAVFVGTGFQIAISILMTLLLSQTKLINPAMKGQALSNIVMLYVFSGTVSGYISARIFKFCGGKNWKLNTIVTAVFFPGTLMAIFILLNIFLAFYGSSKTMSFFTLFCAFLLWVCIASPLVCIGSFIGFKREPIAVPTRTNQIARVIPHQHSVLASKYSSIFIGGLPFSCAVIEIYFLMCSIWMHQYYYLMGYLLTISILIGICSALSSIVMCYLRLTGEDHRWWWKSFADAASCGVWLFGYSFWYLFNRLHLVGVLPYIVYISYMAMISFTLGLYTGAVSFMATFYFNKTIYNAVKID